MRMTLAQAFEAIERDETPVQYARRYAKIRRLVSERIALEDALSVLTDPGDEERAEEKRKRLAKVLTMLEELA